MWVKEIFKGVLRQSKPQRCQHDDYYCQHFIGETLPPCFYRAKQGSRSSGFRTQPLPILFPPRQWYEVTYSTVLSYISWRTRNHAAFVWHFHPERLNHCHSQRKLWTAFSAACFSWSWCAQLLPETNS